MSWLTEIPQLDRSGMTSLKKIIDEAFKGFSRQYGEGIENFFKPLLDFLIFFEKLLLATPWWLMIAILVLITQLAARSVKLSVGVGVALLCIGFLGMWEDTMRTLSLITVCTLLSILIGIPVGILMSRSDRTQKVITPVLDIMQTMPAFVYLIPVVILLGIGRVSGLIAVVIYAIPPVIRLTNLGIRLVDKEVIEAADSYGVTSMQRLWSVQLPLAMPNIMAGINQTIMMALSMVVIASMIGVRGLGLPVLQAINNQYIAQGLLNGSAIVVLAIIFDRVSQAYAKRSQHNIGGQND
ncbi:ABC transporter permease [Reinekea thalattae]|uniref:Proline/glycine betaine ABC transporter permease n=1 Tax=Reinekea thalattae TaxID=2593301 RepID=A0A5C8Z7T9_9GAMM|nr:proline/glycine betaine ABC transporter permease [Reinekea thalattae]TXR53363.1 proline/glycine betaine ABC transporter permease [Reinekea thalattae]